MGVMAEFLLPGFLIPTMHQLQELTVPVDQGGQLSTQNVIIASCISRDLDFLGMISKN